MTRKTGRAAWAASLVIVASLLPAAPAAAEPLGSPQQVSFTEPLDDVQADSTNSAIAYGGGRSLVVWQGGPEIFGRGERPSGTVIMGRFVNGAGAPISDPFPISDNPDEEEHEFNPDVAYDSSRDRFFVVWDSEFVPPSEEDRGGSARIIRGARVAPSGDVSESVVLTPDDRGILEPTVAYGSTTDEFLVAYTDFDAVFVRKVAAEDLVPQDEGQDITSDFGFFFRNDPAPDAAFDPVAGRWLVTFAGAVGTTRGVPVENNTQVYARSFDAGLAGSDPVRISHEGSDDDTESVTPSVAGDETGGGFLVVYEHHGRIFFETPPNGTRGPQSFVPISEIFARRVNGDGSIGGDVEAVSDGTTLSDPPTEEEIEEAFHAAQRPDVWHDPNADQFLVSWAQVTSITLSKRTPRGDTFPDPLAEYEVFGKRVGNGGAPLEDDQQISNHRPDAEQSVEFDGDLPAVTYDRTVCDYVVSWTGEELGEEFDRGFSNEKQEIWDRPYDAPSCPGAAVPPSAAAGEVAASRVCTSRRNFPIRLVKRRDRDYEFAVVKVNGTPVNVTYGDRVRSQVNLVGLPVGRYSVDIEARLESGRTLKGVRRYFTCNRKLPPSNGLDRPEAL